MGESARPRILRVVRITPKAGREKEFERLLDDQILGRLRDVDGLLERHAARPTDYVVTTVRRDKDALRGWCSVWPAAR